MAVTCRVCGGNISLPRRIYCSDICRVLHNRAYDIFRREDRADPDLSHFFDEDELASYLHRLWIDQRGKCAYTDEEMTAEARQPNTVSVDRIHSSGGELYSRGNIALCWSAVNIMKQQLSPEDLQTAALIVVKGYYKSNKRQDIVDLVSELIIRISNDFEGVVIDEGIEQGFDVSEHHNNP